MHELFYFYYNKPIAEAAIDKTIIPTIRTIGLTCFFFKSQKQVSYHDKFEFECINQDYSLQFEDLKHPTEELKQLRQEAKQVLSALQKRNITLI